MSMNAVKTIALSAFVLSGCAVAPADKQVESSLQNRYEGAGFGIIERQFGSSLLRAFYGKFVDEAGNGIDFRIVDHLADGKFNSVKDSAKLAEIIDGVKMRYDSFVGDSALPELRQSIEEICRTLHVKALLDPQGWNNSGYKRNNSREYGTDQKILIRSYQEKRQR